MSLQQELEHACDAFLHSFPSELSAATQSLTSLRSEIRTAYSMAACLQAWKSEFLTSAIAPGALAFFVEAQNDALLSLVLSVQGLSRPSLQSLRSCIENVYATTYYMDHPVELRLWEGGRHRLDRSEYSAYLKSHPNLQDKAPEDCGLVALDSQYTLLNNAVHASRADFRMATHPPDVSLTLTDPVRFRKWHNNLTTVIRGCNLLLIALFGAELSGAQYLGLKRSISLSLTSKQRETARKVHCVSLPTPP